MRETATPELVVGRSPAGPSAVAVSNGQRVSHAGVASAAGASAEAVGHNRTLADQVPSFHIRKFVDHMLLKRWRNTLGFVGVKSRENSQQPGFSRLTSGASGEQSPTPWPS